MRSLFLTLMGALLCAQSVAQDGWVSVGSTPVVKPVAESEAKPNSTTQVSLPANSSNSDLISELLLQVEQMQQEIATLRGQLDQQTAKVKQMEVSQKDRYLDLDRRISKLMLSGSDNGILAAPVTPVSENSAVVTPTVAETKLNAQSDYDQAYGLLKERKFDEAEGAFDKFVENHPNNTLVANALYWSAEIGLIRGNLDKSTSHFRQIVNQYPEHNKAPDALYKLAVTEHRQGNNTEAKVLLNRVIDEYTGIADGTVVLAKSYLTKIAD